MTERGQSMSAVQAGRASTWRAGLTPFAICPVSKVHSSGALVRLLLRIAARGGLVASFDAALAELRPKQTIWLPAARLLAPSGAARMSDMASYLVPVTFPDLDTAKRDAGSLVEALRTAGMHAEAVDDAAFERGDDAGRRDPGQTIRQVRVHAESVEEVRGRVQQVVEGQFPPGMVLVGEPTRA